MDVSDVMTEDHGTGDDDTSKFRVRVFNLLTVADTQDLIVENKCIESPLVLK